MGNPNALDETIQLELSTAHLPFTLAPGAVVAGYVVEERAAKGGFATVYRARSQATGETVALKLLHPEHATSGPLVRRFHQEADALNRIAHPSIVQVFAVGTIGSGQPFFIMEWIDGHTLEQELAERGPFSVDELVGVLDPLCAALAVAHAAGVIHRDLKPSNVMVIPRGDWFDVKLVDFGIAKLLEHGSPGDAKGLTTTGVHLGTPSFMAPEQLLGQAMDARTDIYALGVISYYLLTGQRPFVGRSASEYQELHLSAAPPRVSDRVPVPPAIDAVVQRCLAKAREDRYPSVHHFLDDLRRADAGAALMGPPSRRGMPASPPSESSSATQAVGIYVEVSFDGAEDELDDATITAIDDLLARAQTKLGAAGLEIAFTAGTSFCAIREAGGTEESAAEKRAATITLALDLHERLTAGEGRPARVRVAVMVHAASVVRRRAEGQRAHVEGELLHLSRWTVGKPRDGVVATDESLAGLEGRFELAPVTEVPGRRRVLGARPGRGTPKE